jgi:Fe-S cluster assembly protein SufD
METIIAKNNVAAFAEDFTSQVNYNHAKQAEAKSKLESLSFPTTRDERWKYTRVSKVAKGAFNTVTDSKKIDLSSIHRLDSQFKLVLNNGVVDKNLSVLPSIEGVTVMSMSDALISKTDIVSEYFGKHVHTDEVFPNINTAFAQDGLFLHIAKNVKLEESIEIITINSEDKTWSNPRHLFIAEQGAQFHVVNVLPESGSGSLVNEVTEIFVGDNANVSYDKLQYQTSDSFYFGTEQVYQKGNSTFSINSITTNGQLVRNDLNIIVDGENCDTNLAGVYAGKDKQHIDNHTTVDHLKGHCESNEVYKGVMDGNSTGVFNGKVFVRPNAQKINAYQSNGNVLLSKDASVKSKPELEIYADDVRCSHGSTIGQLDEEGVFYLRSRGLSEKNARKLMVSAFITQALEEIKSESVREFVEGLLDKRFQL